MRATMLKCMLVVALLLTTLTAARADTIPMQATVLDGRTVQLDWTAMGGGTATLYRQYPSSTAVSLGTVTGGHYTDHLARCVCGDTVRYKVVQGIDSGNVAVYVDDNEPTAPAEWGVVTVDEVSQAILLHWEASADTDIMGYLVCEGTPSMAIDTVFGRDITHYSPANYDVTTEYHFRICAFDSCRQTSALTESCNNIVVHCQNETCSHHVTVQWNVYHEMPGGVLRYDVWASEDGGAAVRVAQVNAGDELRAEFDAGSQSQRVAVTVEAIPVGGPMPRVLSNRAEVVFSTIAGPDYLYMRKVSVDDDATAVTLVAQTDPAFAQNDYRIYRQTDASGTAVVTNVHASGDGTIAWTDHSATPREHGYTYWIGVDDGCGGDGRQSQRASTLRAEIEGMGSDAVLHWNAYDGWSGTTSYTVLSRGIEEPFWQAEGITATTELPLVIDALGGARLYKVVAREAANSQWQRDDTLQSAAVTFSPRTNMWLPNVFTPAESANNSFGPVFAYVDAVDYRFMVYDRRGNQLFSTSDPMASWDGTAGGHPMPQGVYVYQITYRQNDGTTQKTTGTVLLLR